MDETALAAWQRALVEALLAGGTAADVRAHLLAALPDERGRIAKLDERGLAVAIDLVRRWSPHAAPRERG